MTINFPIHVAQTAVENKPIVERKLTVRGVELSFREFADGYVSVNSVVGVAGKANLNLYGKIRGFLGALADLGSNGDFVPGFHCKMGIKNALSAWDTSVDEFGNPVPVVYVNWKYLHNAQYAERNAPYIKLLADHGITREGTKAEHANYWLKVGAKRNGFFPIGVNVPWTWDEYVSWLKEAKGLAPKDPEAKFYTQSVYEKKWGIQNRHDGFETALRLLGGELFVQLRINELTNESEIKRAATRYQMLWSSTEDREAADREASERGQAQRRLGRLAYAAAHDDKFELGEYASLVAHTDVATIFQDGGMVVVNKSELLNRRLAFVYADGSRVDGSSVYVPNEVALTMAFQMAESLKAAVALA